MVCGGMPTPQLAGFFFTTVITVYGQLCLYLVVECVWCVLVWFPCELASSSIETKQFQGLFVGIKCVKLIRPVS